MRNHPPDRVPENAPGDFYVEAGSCMRCCIIHDVAPDLLNDASVEFRECYFRRQPETPADIERAIAAMDLCDVAALRYGGTDQAILKRMHQAGLDDLCDHAEKAGG